MPTCAASLYSPDPHIMPYAYAFVGLTPSERALLGSIFALEGNDLIRVRNLADADLLVANGDDHLMVRQLRQTNPGALLVLVGQPDSVELTALPTLTRPLELGAVTRVLSTLDWSGQQPGQPASELSMQTFSATELPSSQWLHTHTSAPTELMPRESRSGGSGGGGATTAPRAGNWYGPPADTDADVMVVVGPHVGPPHTLALGLRRLGYHVCVAESEAHARLIMERRPTTFIFLDQISLGPQLIPLARVLAAMRRSPDASPYVIVVARSPNMFDRMRVRLLGCIWMTAPVQAKRIMEFFSRRGLEPR